MADKGIHVTGPVIGSNIGTSGYAKAGDVRINLVRHLDTLKAELLADSVPETAIKAVDDLRVEAQKPKPSRDVTHQLIGTLNDKGLTEQMRGLAEAFEKLY